MIILYYIDLKIQKERKYSQFFVIWNGIVRVTYVLLYPGWSRS